VGTGAAGDRLGPGGGAVFIVVLGLLLAMSAAVVAAVRFEWFLIGLLAVRPVLDLAKHGGSSLLDPSTAVGVVFILVSCRWLYRRWHAGELLRPSPGTLALLVMAAVFAASVAGSEQLVVSASATLRVVAGALMFAVLEQLLPGRPQLARRVLAAALASAIVPLTLGVYQALTVSEASAFTDVSRVQGTFVHPNPFATYLAIILLAAIAVWPALEGRLRLAAGGLVMVSGAVLILTYTRSSWLGALVGLGYLVTRRRRGMLIPLVVLVAAVVLAVPSVSVRIMDLSKAPPVAGVPANSLSWRVGYWKRLLPLADRDPLTGVGLETVQLISQEKLQPHNVFVQTYVETGAFGLAALCTAILAMAATLRRRRQRSAVGFESSLAHAAIANGLCLLVTLPSDNLLTQTIVYWYFAAACAFGYSAHRPLPMARGQSARVLSS